MKEIFSCQNNNLADFLANSIQLIADYLDMNTKFVKSSSLEGNALLKREFRIYDFCERLGADTYVNAIGGMELYNFEEFKSRGLELQFLKTRDITYKQFDNVFVENLSILDVIMFNSKDEVKRMLGEFDLVKG